MDTQTEIREFLTSRRAKISPEQAGLTTYGRRRVPGLRRGEVAVLAGVSVPYYTRIERGNMNGVSDSVLEAIARALSLDEAERPHLFDLARALRPTSGPRPRRARRQRLRPSIQHVLDALTGAAAFVHNARLDNLAANQLGYALYSNMFGRAAGPGPVNSARFVFLDPGAPDFYADWERAASDVVAILRTAAGRDPYDRELSDLVGELSTQSVEFRTRWAVHNVRFHHTGTSTTPAPRSSTTQSSATSLSPTTAWSSPPTRAWRSRSTPPNRIQVSADAQPPRQLGRDSRTAGAAGSARRSALYLTTRTGRSMPSWVCSRRSWVSMKHAST